MTLKVGFCPTSFVFLGLAFFLVSCLEKLNFGKKEEKREPSDETTQTRGTQTQKST